MVLECHLNAVDSKFVSGPHLSLELQALISQLHWLLDISRWMSNRSLKCNNTKLQIFCSECDAALPSLPFRTEVPISLAHKKPLPKNCSQLKGAVLLKVTSSLEASLFQCLLNVGVSMAWSPCLNLRQLSRVIELHIGSTEASVKTGSLLCLPDPTSLTLSLQVGSCNMNRCLRSVFWGIWLR